MSKQIVYFLNSILVTLILMLFTACATSMPVETPQEAISFSDNAKPLIQAKLDEVLIEPFTKEAREIWFREKSFSLAEKDLNNKLSTLLRSHGIFKISAGDFIDVRAKPISMNDPNEGLFAVLVELIVKYEFSTDKGNLIITETITSQGTSRAMSGVVRVEESIKNAVSANVAKLSHAIKQKLPGAWRSYVERREATRRRIATNLKKENRYFRVTSAKAMVRNMPDPDAMEVASLPQADLLHVTGSLPSGWLQVSREGKPLGWVHSSLLREDLAASPSYRPVVALPPSPPLKAPASEDIAALDFGSYHALVVGNNEYRHLPKLRTAVNDARVMSNLLQDKYGFKVRILMNATRADILQALNEYRLTLNKRDNLLIYYAGHGWLDKEANEGYWLPVDAEGQNPINWISNGSITNALRAMQAKHVLVVADSCFSGKLARGINVRLRTRNYYERIVKKKARTVMASGGLEPVADDGGKGSHSVFAAALIEALNENQGVLDATLLFSQIRRPVMVNTDQTPEYSDIRKAGHDGGDFLFVRQK